MRIGSLFSGIGGLELGLEWAGLGPTIWQVESDSRCRKVLAKHWPDATRFEDVRTVGSRCLAPVDLICGGFPCQNVSSAGAREGITAPRSGLWIEFDRVVRELRPSWIVVENVTSGADLWLDTVVTDLEAQGYACLPAPVAACDVGAPHGRGRLFVVASNAHGKGKPVVPVYAEVASSPALVGGSRHAGWRSPEPEMVRVVDGLPRGLDRPKQRISALGNAVVPQCAEVVGHIILELMR